MRDDLHPVCVEVRYGYAGNKKYGWWAKLGWQDGKFIEDGAIEGSICTRYAHPNLAVSIDYVVEVAEQFGLLNNILPKLGLFLCYTGDGEFPQYPPPAGWIDLLRKEAKKRGWKSYGTKANGSQMIQPQGKSIDLVEEPLND